MNSNVVDLAPLVTQIIQTLAYIFLAAVAYWLQGHVKDENSRKAILDAAENGVNNALNRLDGITKTSTVLTVPVASKAGAMAINYVMEMVPDAVKRLGLDEKSIAKLVVAKLPGVGGEIDDATLDQIAKSSANPSAIPTDFPALVDALTPALVPALTQVVDKAIKNHFASAAMKEVPTPPPVG